MSDTADETAGHYLSLAATDPWAVVMEGLAHQARGEALSEDLSDGVAAAAAALAAATLIKAGGDVDAVIRQFEERDHTVAITYTGATREVGIVITWDDDTTTTATRPVPDEPMTDAQPFRVCIDCGDGTDVALVRVDGGTEPLCGDCREMHGLEAVSV